MIYLYLKEHKTTGLKYLGKTVKDPFKYKGSGVLWLKHLNKHGNDVTTKILFASDDKTIFNKVAIQYSKNLNIVESNDFANLCEEQGQGGKTWQFGKKASKNVNYKLRSKRFNGITHHKSKKVLINGVIYGSAREASRILNVSHTTISYRCRKNIQGYSYIN